VDSTPNDWTWMRVRSLPFAVLQMRAGINSLLLILLAMTAGSAQRRVKYGENPLAKIDSVFTAFSPEECKLTKLKGNPYRVCPPVVGYQLLYGGAETSPQIIILTPNRKQHVLRYWDLKAGNFISLEKGATWILTRRSGKVMPMALILRANTKPAEFTRFPGNYTIIAKLTPQKVCVIGRIPANSTSAMTEASVSNSPLGRKCIGVDDVGEKDWLGLVFGLSRKGRYEDARSALKKIRSTGARTIAYAHIARAQAESGDQAAARATLFQGLGEVLKEKAVSSYYDEYGTQVQASTRETDLLTILTAMAAVGLDDDVNNNLKFVNNSDLARALLWIGSAQGSSRSEGGRGDHDAAKATFDKAIQLEQKREDTVTADSNLISIVEAQVSASLINDARRTVLLIRNPAARKVAEDRIPPMPGKPD
jgi:hypothetical protein